MCLPRGRFTKEISSSQSTLIDYDKGREQRLNRLIRGADLIEGSNCASTCADDWIGDHSFTQTQAFRQVAQPVSPVFVVRNHGVAPAPHLHWLPCAIRPIPIAASESLPSLVWQPCCGKFDMKPHRARALSFPR